MNPSNNNDLTAYALGELTPADATRVRQQLAQSPEARTEYERLSQTIGALRAQASLPKRSLTPQQREAVLKAPQKPLAQKPRIVNFPSPHAKTASPFWMIAKLAAAACLALGAFMIGQKSGRHQAAAVAVVKLPAALPKSASVAAATPAVVVASSKSEEPKKASAEKTTPAKQSETAPPTVVVVAAAPPSVPPSFREQIIVAPPLKLDVPVEKPKAPAPVVVQSKPKPAPFVTPQASLTAFTSVTGQQQESALYFHPKMVKPVTQVFANKEIILAAPLPYNVKSTPQVEPKRKVEQPPLVIHTWKAEIASCPWDSSRRLMRITATIPVDQPAVESNDQAYRISAKFDPFQVQGYRIVAEKHMAPSAGGTLATRFAWYEIIPTRNFAPTSEKPVSLGTLEIVQPKHPGNRDSAPLRMLDRGVRWSEAREDYVFETAMIGFSLLMQGTPNIGALDHRMVLDVAEKAKGEDPKGERAKFIKAVQQAQRAAGL